MQIKASLSVLNNDNYCYYSNEKSQIVIITINYFEHHILMLNNYISLHNINIVLLSHVEINYKITITTIHRYKVISFRANLIVDKAINSFLSQCCLYLI